MTKEREAHEEAADEEPRRVYTRQDVINQSLVAFGQGTNFMRVSSLACREFVRLMNVTARRENVIEQWGEIAVQLLERIRMVGRVAQAWAVEDGLTVIGDGHVRRAFRKVQLASKTDSCGDDEDGDSGARRPDDYP